MPKGRNQFNKKWLKRREFSTWLKPASSSKTRAYCQICCKSFEIRSMGLSSLTSHMKGTKHVRDMKEKETLDLAKKDSEFISQFLVSTDVSSSQQPERSAVITLETVRTASTAGVVQTGNDSSGNASLVNMSSFVSRDDVSKAEIRWALKSEMSHFSYNSSSELNDGDSDG
jgi:hypothetical protein